MDTAVLIDTPADPSERRRLAVVVAGYSAAAGAPPGIEVAAFAAACLADTYEVLADLEQAQSAIAGVGPAVADLLWPQDRQIGSQTTSLRAIADQLAGQADELIFVPADAPDLPGLVVAKVFKALYRADVCLAMERTTAARRGCVAIGVRLPWPDWITFDLNLDQDPHDRLLAHAPRRSLVAVGPDWHRMRTADSVHRLDPGLEGWEMTRALLSGQVFSALAVAGEEPADDQI